MFAFEQTKINESYSKRKTQSRSSTKRCDSLYYFSKTGTDAGTGYFCEYAGEVFENMSMEGRMTVCNMSIEMGARGGMIAPDETTFNYVKGRQFAPKGRMGRKLAYWKTLKTDEGAIF